MEDKLLLEMRNIGKSFPGVRALDDVSITLGKGKVHVLLGENGAGKSTLIKVLCGQYTDYDGQIILNGEKVSFKDTKDAVNHGIATIYQELNQVPAMTVGQNLYLSREPMKGPFIDDKKLYELSEVLLKENGLDIAAKEMVSNLSVSQMQMVEIAKAVSRNAQIVIMDEPTSALSDKEVSILFGHIERLKRQGVGIIYISHRMEEIFEIGDEVTVLRDGKFIQTLDVKSTDREELIKLMVGRELNNIYPRRADETVSEEVKLEVKNLSGEKFKDVSFQLHKGELLGIAGLMGAGRTELARALFGMDRIESGEIYLDGKLLKIKNTGDAVKKGILMVSEDRKRYGLVHIHSISDNIGLPNLKQFVKGGLVNDKQERKTNQVFFDDLGVKAPNMDYLVSTLSGGNQQKVVLAKWLEANPQILIMDEPTRGIDVGAKHEIYEIINNLLDRGVSIIMISSELPEIIGMCNRVLVMCEHRVAGELLEENITQERILDLAMA